MSTATIELTPDQYRDGLSVNAISKYNDPYTRLSFLEGKWMLDGNTRYGAISVEGAKKLVCREGAVEDFDLIAAAPIYVRLGKLPEGGRSKNYRDGGCEPGVSCFRAAWDGKTLVIEANAGVILFDAGRGLYLIDGELCDETGSDDEPCLRNATIVRKISAKTSVRFAR